MKLVSIPFLSLYSFVNHLLFGLQYLSDGRSFVDCIATRRFQVRERGMQDGYHTARVDYVDDEEEEDILRLRIVAQDLLHAMTEMNVGREMAPPAKSFLLEADGVSTPCLLFVDLHTAAHATFGPSAALLLVG